MDVRNGSTIEEKGKLHTNSIVKVEVRVAGLLATTDEESKDS